VAAEETVEVLGRVPLVDDEELVVTDRELVVNGAELLRVHGDLFEQLAVLGEHLKAALLPVPRVRRSYVPTLVTSGSIR
jgi:hypothetical protein